MVTKTQTINIVVLVLMGALVIAVHVAQAYNIPVPADIISVSGLAAAAVAGACRSYLPQFAGIIPPPATIAAATPIIGSQKGELPINEG